jgi:hypothetical protein
LADPDDRVTLEEMIEALWTEIADTEIVQKLLEEQGCTINQTERRRLLAKRRAMETLELVQQHQDAFREIVRAGSAHKPAHRR